MAIKKALASEAARLLGSIKTPKKSAASRATGKQFGGRPIKPLEQLDCTCGKCPDAPKTYCPRGRAILRRREAQEDARDVMEAERRLDASNPAEHKTLDELRQALGK